MELIELVRLLEMKTGKSVKKSGGGYVGCCPAHNDSSPSLSLCEGNEGKLLINCFTGCSSENKGLITCTTCGCVVTPEIHKGRYIYYSCTNGKGVCKRTYVREEPLIASLLEYFDKIALNADQVDEITNYLKEIHSSESAFLRESMQSLRKEQDKLQM